MTTTAQSRRSAESRPRALSAGHGDLLGLVDSIYQSATGELPCASAVKALRQHLDAAWVALMLRPATPSRPALVVTAGGPISLPSESPYLNIDDIPPGGVFKDIDAKGVQVLESPGMRGSQHIIGADLVVSPSFRARLRIGRVRRGVAFSARDKALVQSLLPHFLRVLRSHDESAVGGMESQVLRIAVDSLGLGVIVLGESGEILHVNQCAERTLRERKHIGVVSGTIHCLDSSDDRRLKGAIRIAHARRRESGARTGVAVFAGRNECDAWVSMLVRGLPPGPPSCGERAAAVAIYIRRSDQRGDMSVDAVREVFGLTRTEGVLALHMAEGASLDEAAAALEIRRNTARTHLRSIFAKTGVRRQPELVRVLLGSVALMS
jgi:DNA-binding CsgD family transcriptional regulator